MNKFTGALCAVSLTFVLAACSGADEANTEEAASAGTFVGTWVGQPETLQNDLVRKYVIADGTYTCNHCNPAYSVPVSGDFEPVDRPGVDEVKVAVVDDNTIEFATRFEDKETSKGSWTVSEDGNTLTVESTDMSGEKPVVSVTSLTRASAGPEGSHAASGDWKFAELERRDEEARTVSYSIEGDQLTRTDSDGSLTMTIGGEGVVPEWSTTGAAISVEKISDTSYKFITKFDDVVVWEQTMTADGDTMNASGTNPRDGYSLTWKAKRKTT